MSNGKYLVVLSAPSGCGKDTMVTALKDIDPNIEVSVSCTTREPREGEQDGIDYYFLDHAQFARRIDEGRMLEYTEYMGNFYGTPLDEIRRRIEQHKTVLLIIEVCGGASVKRLFPDALLIFIKPPSLWELRKRLIKRGTESRREIRGRLRVAREELKRTPEYDFTVVNDDVERCSTEIYNIIKKWQA